MMGKEKGVVQKIANNVGKISNMNVPLADVF